MPFISLVTPRGGVWVNSDQIAFLATRSNGGTRIHFAEKNHLDVRDSVDQIATKLAAHEHARSS